MAGFAFFPSNESKPYFLNMLEGTKDVVSLEEKWSFMTDFLETPHVTKVCFESQESLKPVLQRNEHRKYLLLVELIA
jgi:hypothetical protein